MSWYVSSQNVTDSSGLHQLCTYSPGIATGKNYACGGLNSSGTRWRFDPGQGQTWAFQVIAKIPPTTGEEDPSFWFSDPAWTDEIDAPEWWGWDAGTGGIDWLPAKDGMGLPAVPRSNGSGSPHGESGYYWGSAMSFAPDIAYHTYTVEMVGTTFYSWVDGTPMAKGMTVGSVGGWAKVWDEIRLQHSLRDPTTGNPSPYFKSGSRSFDVRSIAVYEDANANNAATQNGPVIAPGTTVN